jgi:hypothetical protein
MCTVSSGGDGDDGDRTSGTTLAHVRAERG